MVRRKARSNAANRQSNKQKKKSKPSVAKTQKQLAQMAIAKAPFAHVGGTIGSGLGSLFGNPNLGRGVGSWLGSGIGKFFGSGAYKLNKNSIWSSDDQCPVMHNGSESVIVRHREYITDVYSSISFVANTFQINPGLQSVFPFLSTIAQNFQEYKFRGLVFEFKSTSADALNSTNTALGTIAMAVQYRANAPSFTNKQQLLNEMWSQDSKPANSFFMPVECAPSECPMDIQYVRTGALGASDDIKFYDLGRLVLASVGSQATAVVGELWASYEVELKKPILGGASGYDAQSCIIYRSGVSTGSPIGNNTVVVNDNSLGVTFINTQSFSIPAQGEKLFISLQWSGPGSSAWSPPNLVVTNSTQITVNGVGDLFLGVATSSSGCATSGYFQPVDPTQPMVATVYTNGTLSTPVYLYLSITQVNASTVST